MIMSAEERERWEAEDAKRRQGRAAPERRRSQEELAAGAVAHRYGGDPGQIQRALEAAGASAAGCKAFLAAVFPAGAPAGVGPHDVVHWLAHSSPPASFSWDGLVQYARGGNR
jgi:hypothetical protein